VDDYSHGQVRAEWLVIRRETERRLCVHPVERPADTPAPTLIAASCQRYFTERVYEEAKTDLGWAEFQALKYRAWEHHLALTALALWFVAETKWQWAQTYTRDPHLRQQLEVEVLPRCRRPTCVNCCGRVARANAHPGECHPDCYSDIAGPRRVYTQSIEGSN